VINDLSPQTIPWRTRERERERDQWEAEILILGDGTN